MDWKTVGIGVLVVTAVLLGGVVMSGLRQDGAAYGQGGVYATYLVGTANVQDSYTNFAVLDTDLRRMLFYRVDTATLKLDRVKGILLDKEFKRAP
jgi:hypothetical protein